MDGKLITGICLLIVPAALIGVTILRFSSNPVAIFTFLALMLFGAFYLLTYKETFA